MHVKILYCKRIFSGIEKSILKKKWNPTGVPTIYKLIEEFDKNLDVSFIFSDKGSNCNHLSEWKGLKNERIFLEGIKSEVFVLSSGGKFVSKLPRKIRNIYRELSHLIFTLIEIKKKNPEIVYFDHANSITAAFVSRFTKIKVVYRLMGIYPSMRNCLNSFSLKNIFYRWCYSSPFNLVICTQDGSGVEPWLKKALSKKTNIEVLLNGVDKNFPNTSQTLINEYFGKLPKDKKTITFIGKLEKYKGCHEFVDAMIEVNKIHDKTVHSLIIGYGNEFDEIFTKIRSNNQLHKFTFIKRLPHQLIHFAHKYSHIYISMNYLGNLSNSNLEAIRNEQCIILPQPDNKTGIDTITYKILKDSVFWVKRDNANDLIEKVLMIINSDEIRKEKVLKIRSVSEKYLLSWRERINKEISLINNLQ